MLELVWGVWDDLKMPRSGVINTGHGRGWSPGNPKPAVWGTMVVWSLH